MNSKNYGETRLTECIFDDLGSNLSFQPYGINMPCLVELNQIDPNNIWKKYSQQRRVKKQGWCPICKSAIPSCTQITQQKGHKKSMSPCLSSSSQNENSSDFRL